MKVRNLIEITVSSLTLYFISNFPMQSEELFNPYLSKHRVKESRVDDESI